eukprot:6461835-Amphidinium_carterae.2
MRNLHFPFQTRQHERMAQQKVAPRTEIRDMHKVPPAESIASSAFWDELHVLPWTVADIWRASSRRASSCRTNSGASACIDRAEVSSAAHLQPSKSGGFGLYKVHGHGMC